MKEAKSRKKEAHVDDVYCVGIVLRRRRTSMKA